MIFLCPRKGKYAKQKMMVQEGKLYLVVVGMMKEDVYEFICNVPLEITTQRQATDWVRRNIKDEPKEIPFSHLRGRNNYE